MLDTAPTYDPVANLPIRLLPPRGRLQVPDAVTAKVAVDR